MKLLLENWRKYLNEERSVAPRGGYTQREFFNREDITYEFLEKIANLVINNPENQEKYHISRKTAANLLKALSQHRGAGWSEEGWLLNHVRQDQWDEGVPEEDLLDVDIFERVIEDPEEEESFASRFPLGQDFSEPEDEEEEPWPEHWGQDFSEEDDDE